MSKILVWFSEIPWDFLVQRHHHLIENLPSDWRVIFLESISRYKFRLRHLRQGNVVAVPLFINGLLLELPLVGLIFRLINRIYLPLVLRWYGVRKNEFITVLSNVFVFDLAKGIGGSAIVYDCNDDIASFPNLPASTHKCFEETIRQAQMVVCSSRPLYSRIKLQKKNAHLIGNGVSGYFIDIAKNLHRLGLEPPPLAIGFIGVLSEWIDFELLEKVAQHFPRTELCIVGPVVKSCRGQIKRLKAYPNVSLIGLVPYQRLPFYLARLKVGLIPFNHSQLTFSVNPNKLYEYAAFGIQIVSTDFSTDVTQYFDKIRIAENHDQFLQQVEKALLRRPVLDRSLLKIAEENTWQQKASRFNRLLLDVSGSVRQIPARGLNGLARSPRF